VTVGLLGLKLEILNFYALAALVTAPVFGSFLGVLVKRLPAGESFISSRSRCPSCHKQLSIRDLIPIVSWVAVKGRCRHCEGKISVFYPAIESLALAIAIWTTIVVPDWLIWPTCALGWTLLALSFIDSQDFILPDQLTLPLIVLGLGTAYFLAPERFGLHITGVGVGFALFKTVGIIYRRIRQREGLGGGDAKLIAASGAWVSLSGLPSVILVASLVALAWTVLTKRSSIPPPPLTAIPFGPFIALATWLVWLYGPLKLSLPLY